MENTSDNILIVEDEIMIASHYKMFLEKKGYKVIGIAATGEKAIYLAMQNKPVCILMDINLVGEMDGIQAAEKIKKEIQTNIIFITGYDDPETRMRAEGINPAAYYVKPINFTNLIEDITKVIFKNI
ncbi:MAG: response regulator [Leptospiraceae bacterium]|nr:response regulator [Leptospiraceae bacterium]